MTFNISWDRNALIAKLTPADAAKMQSIPINAVLTGNFTNQKLAPI
jgi:hypothetical protein